MAREQKKPIILYEDNHLLVVEKPVNMPTHGMLPEIWIYLHC